MHKIILLLLLITLLFFAASCSSPAKKDLNKMLDIKLEQGIKNVEIKDLGQLVIVQNTYRLLTPLFLALFAGIILVVSGVRAIGFGVVVASLTCITLIITMAVYMKVIALVGIGVFVVGIYFLGKSIYDNHITKRDLVNSTQLVKRYVSEDDKKELKVALTKIQSKHTQKIVREIKN